MDDAKQQLIDKLKSSNNVLVTVGRDPSVDQLAALLGLTLFLNKLGKHAAAVFSGEVPSTIEFLKPEETIEKNTDSLRDFIIALDKSKADKLRYKVEDDIVRIFITPYRTSITQDDLEFSQGDFNVDLVVAIGVKQQEDLDEAIVAHGRILHDATVASINSAEGGIGTINWHEPGASSLSEQATELVQALGADRLDQQIATALLTGVVAETERFSNAKTTPQTMSISAALMSAGANQQLVASQLAGPSADAASIDVAAPAKRDGTLEISHDENADQDGVEPEPGSGGPTFELPAPDEDGLSDAIEPEEPEPPVSESAASPDSPALPEQPEADKPEVSPGAKLITEPPTLGGTLTANSTQQYGIEPTTDPLSTAQADGPLLDHQPLEPPASPVPPAPASQPPAPEPPSPDPGQPGPTLDEVLNNPEHRDPDMPPVPPNPASTTTLADIEQSVSSPHTDESNVDAARDEVSKALTQAAFDGAAAPEPVQALNAQPMTGSLHSAQPAVPPAPAASPEPPQPADPHAPPPVPPPIPFQFGNQPPQQ